MSPLVGWADLRREPFRLFFPLAVVWGCIGVGHWLSYAIGLRASYSGWHHASMQVGAYLTCFIVGFLLTALPRFASAPPASSIELALALSLAIAYVVSLWSAHWTAAELSWVGLLAFVAVFAGRRFATRRHPIGPPTEFVWIPLGLAFGIVGASLLAASRLGLISSWWMGLARPMAQQGFLLAIVLGVGGFLAPRLLGREPSLAMPPGVSPTAVQRLRRRRMSLHGLAAMCLAISFWLEAGGRIAVAYFLRAGVVTAEFLWTAALYRLPSTSDRYVQFLWVSMWLMVAGLWGAGLSPRWRIAMLHVTFLGGFSLMTFAVGTMVAFSHTGQAARLRQPLWALRIVGLGMAGALAARLIAEGQPETFFTWLGVAAVCWLTAGLGWLACLAPSLLRPVEPDAFERAHEEAKRRLLRSSATASTQA